MITNDLLLTLFEGHSIQRWCDLVRVVDLTEVDKAAEKLMVSFIIGRFEEQRGLVIDWVWIINAALFDYLQKLALCDIKEPLQKILKERYKDEYLKLNDYVLSSYKTLLHDNDLFSKFTIYMGQKAGNFKIPVKSKLAQRVYNAASKFATLRELEIIAPVNESERLFAIKKSLTKDLQEYLDLLGLQKLITKQEPFEFLLRAESLRFQIRWNQTPRVPATSVMGHSFFVAILTQLLMRYYKTPPCDERFTDTYFCALFHDLSECVTRDIISPVKSATPGLGGVIKDIERDIVNLELVPYMDDAIKDDVLYYCLNEFSNRVILQSNEMPGDIHKNKVTILNLSADDNDANDTNKKSSPRNQKHPRNSKKQSVTLNNDTAAVKKVTVVTFDELSTIYNKKGFRAVDGKTVRIADHLSALLEAVVSIKHGVTSRHLTDGVKSLMSTYKKGIFINDINVYDIFSSINNITML